MANEKQVENTKISEGFLYKKTLPVLIGLGVVSLLSAVGLILCIHFHIDVVLYIFAIVIAVGSLGLITFILIMVRKYGKELEESLSVMDKQLDDFAKGDIKISSVRHHFPTIERLQERINSAISRYSQYRLVYTSQSEDEELKEKIASGAVFEFKEFQEHLYKEVQNNLSFRSALLFIRAEGSDPIAEKVMEALHQKILASFPGAIVGKVDDKTFAVYDYAVDSFLSLQGLCEQFVASFNEFSLSAFDDLSYVNYCKVGAVVYPYTPVTNLVQDGLKALEESKDVSINVGLRSVYYPHAILSESNRRVIYLASVESFQASFHEAKTYAEQIGALKDFVRWFAVMGDFEVGGVMIYNGKTSDYQILMEVGKDKNQRSFSILGERIPSVQIDPFYEAAKKDLSFSAANSDELPASLSSYLANIGVRSFYMAAIVYGGEKRGLVYLTSSKPIPYFSLISRENLNGYVAMVSSLIVSLQARSQQEESQELLESLATRSNKFVYTIDRSSHKITYMSENLRRAFPEAKIGDICYEALRSDHTSPCSRCPLEHGVDHRIISRISSTDCSVSVLQFRGADNAYSSILIEQTQNQETALAGNALIDEMILIKNAQALSLDLSHQIKMGAVGYVVSVKLLDSEALLSRLPGADANSLMAALAKSVQNAGYGDILYRYDTFELSFLLVSYTKSKINDFVEEIASLLTDQIDVKDVSFKPRLAYSAISYPNEANSAKEAMSLIHNELERSETFGDGYLAEVANKHPRKALRDEYIMDCLRDSLSRDEMPIAIQGVVDNKTHKVVMGDVLVRLFGTDGLPIPPAEFIPLAQEHKLIAKIDLGALRGMGILYENYAYTYFKNEGITNLCMYVNPETVKDTSFPEEVKKIFARYKFPKNYVIFNIDSKDISHIENELRNLMNALNGFGIIFQAINYEPEIVSLDTLRGLGMSYIRTDRTLVWEAVSTPNDFSAFSRFVEAALRGGFFITCYGVETSEEAELVNHLEIQRSQGYFYSRPNDEQGFIKLINYGN